MELTTRVRRPWPEFAPITTIGVSPAVGDSGVGQLNASFHAALSGGWVINIHDDVTGEVASPQPNPPGRLEPFGNAEHICDTDIVGTWAVFASPNRKSLDLWASEIILDGEVLDLTRTAPRRWVDGPVDWWPAEGVPVLGTLSVGDHLIESTFTFDSVLVSSFTTDVHVADC